MTADTQMESSKEQPASNFEDGERREMQEALQDVLSSWSSNSNRRNQEQETIPVEANFPQLDLDMDEINDWKWLK